MEEKRSNAVGGVGGLVLCTLIGFVGALVVGWVVFPKLLFSEKTQPLRFSHTIHTRVGLKCEKCHRLGSDGRFVGLPTLETCIRATKTRRPSPRPTPRRSISSSKKYAKTDTQVPWLVYQYQPDNVFFSHAAHQGFACSQCHPDVAKMDSPPALF
jgi:hypothetical protein